MNEIKVFDNAEFGAIRITRIDGEIYFVGKDVVEILGYCNSRKALADHVDDEDKVQRDGVTIRDSMGREQAPTFINESGLYSLILSSKLPTAKRFKRWVTSEVLPSIRKNGGYIAGQENLSDDELLAKALMVAQNKIAERDKIIEQKQKHIDRMKPKEIFADAVATSRTSILIGDLAKIIRQNGYEIGQRRLFDWMREKGYLIKRKGSDWNMPTQKSVDMGLLEIKESIIQNADGSVRINKTPKITGRGQQYFVNKFLGLCQT